MPVPLAITAMRQSAYNCGQFAFQFLNPQGASSGRPQITRNFHVYLELTMQCKHDAIIRGYVQTINVESRRADGMQVRHAQGATALTILAPSGFYSQKARIAADVIKTQMVSKWSRPQLPGVEVFTLGRREDASVQMQVQSDGYQYEISYWYEGKDIYVLYHCYPSR